MVLVKSARLVEIVCGAGQVCKVRRPVDCLTRRGLFCLKVDLLSHLMCLDSNCKHMIQRLEPNQLFSRAADVNHC